MTLTNTKFSLLVCCIALLTSCNITTTKTKNPVFNDQAKVQTELTDLVSAENINLNGKEIKRNKKLTSELEISITNAQNVPPTDDQRKALEKSIATIIKNNLKDPKAFDIYKVLFVTKVESGGVTKSNSTGDVFNSTEL